MGSPHFRRDQRDIPTQEERGEACTDCRALKQSWPHADAHTTAEARQHLASRGPRVHATRYRQSLDPLSAVRADASGRQKGEGKEKEKEKGRDEERDEQTKM